MERDVFSIKENRLSYGRGYVYSFQYHLVLCTKYRKKVDHIHLLVDCRKQKQQKTEIQKRKLREMIVCRLHPVMV